MKISTHLVLGFANYSMNKNKRICMFFFPTIYKIQITPIIKINANYLRFIIYGCTHNCSS